MTVVPCCGQCRQGRMRRHMGGGRRAGKDKGPLAEVFRARWGGKVTENRNILWISRRFWPHEVRFV
jgi:hypothetical protein